MKCTEWEERVALYADGDLASGEVAAHLKECASCQLLLSGIRESLALLREAHNQPVDGAHYTAVRTRVLAQIERGKSRRWRFAWMSAMAAAAVMLAIAMRPRPELRLVLPAPQAPGAPAVARVELPKPRTNIATNIATTTETVMMKIETDNPDVVIYWIIESKGDTK